MTTPEVNQPMLTGGSEFEDTSRNLFLKNNRINAELRAD
jgi:hypothetical protein